MRYEIGKIGAHNPTRIRAYKSEEYWLKDKDRPTTELPTGDHGLILDVVLEDELALDPMPITDIWPNDLFVATSHPHTTVWFEFRPLED